MDDHDSNNDTQKMNEILNDLTAAENENENKEAENELIEDDDAADYETPATGIRISYVLTSDEVYKCLYHSDLYKTKGGRAIFQSVILIVASLVFCVTAFLGEPNYKVYNLFFAGICLVLIAVIWLVPHLHMKSMAKMMADGHKTEAEIYPTHIDIGRDDGAWTIPLDGSCQIIEVDHIIMIFTPKGQFPIPERAIEPEYLSEVNAILAAGTCPKEEE